MVIRIAPNFNLFLNQKLKNLQEVSVELNRVSFVIRIITTGRPLGNLQMKNLGNDFKKPEYTYL